MFGVNSFCARSAQRTGAYGFQLPIAMFFEACKKRDTEKAQKLLKEFPTVLLEARNEQGDTGLTLACQGNLFSLICVLIEAGADVLQKNSKFLTPFDILTSQLHRLVSLNDGTTYSKHIHENLTCILLLLKHGVNPNTLNEEGTSFLHILVDLFEKDLVSLHFLQNVFQPNFFPIPLNPNCPDKMGKLPFQSYSEKINLLENFLTQLNILETFNSQDEKSKERMAPERECNLGEGELVMVPQELTKPKGVCVSEFFEACQRGHTEKVQEFLKDCPKSLERNEQIDRGLTLACQHGSLSLICLLIEAGADILHKGSTDLLPLDMLTSQLQGLVLNGSINDDSVLCSLTNKLIAEYLICILLFLKQGANPNTLNENGTSFLHILVDLFEKDLISFSFLKSIFQPIFFPIPVDINLPDKMGKLPFQSNCEKMILLKDFLTQQKILEPFSSKDKKLKERMLPEGGYNLVKLELIQQASKPKEDTLSEFFQACERGDLLEIGVMLKDCPKDLVKTRNNQGDTCLTLACQQGQISLIYLLMGAGADILQKGSTGLLPLDILTSQLHRLGLAYSVNANSSKNSYGNSKDKRIDDYLNCILSLEVRGQS